MTIECVDANQEILLHVNHAQTTSTRIRLTEDGGKRPDGRVHKVLVLPTETAAPVNAATPMIAEEVHSAISKRGLRMAGGNVSLN